MIYYLGLVTLGVNHTCPAANLLKKIAVAVQGPEWVEGKTNTEIFLAAQQFFRSKTRDQLLGLDTELVRTVT